LKTHTVFFFIKTRKGSTFLPLLKKSNEMTTISWTRRSLIYCLAHTPKRLATRLSSNFEHCLKVFIGLCRISSLFKPIPKFNFFRQFWVKERSFMHSSRPSYQVLGKTCFYRLRRTILMLAPTRVQFGKLNDTFLNFCLFSPSIFRVFVLILTLKMILKQNLEVTILISSRLESFQLHLKNTEYKRSYIFQFELEQNCKQEKPIFFLTMDSCSSSNCSI